MFGRVVRTGQFLFPLISSQKQHTAVTHCVRGLGIFCYVCPNCQIEFSYKHQEVLMGEGGGFSLDFFFWVTAEYYLTQPRNGHTHTRTYTFSLKNRVFVFDLQLWFDPSASFLSPSVFILCTLTFAEIGKLTSMSNESISIAENEWIYWNKWGKSYFFQRDELASNFVQFKK